MANITITKKNISLRGSQQRNKGFTLAEVAVSSFIVIFMLIIALDVWMLISAVQMNDSACRDAARAAAQAPDQPTAQNLAFAAVATHKSVAPMFNQSPTVDISNFQFVDYTGGATIPAGQTPYVRVTTFCIVHPIIPLSVFGSLIIGNGNTLRFNQTYEFPLVKSKALPN
jgi:hypothetical protein